MSSYGSNADMETPVPLVNDVVNNALFHSNQSDIASNHSHPALLSGSSLNCAPNFVVS